MPPSSLQGLNIIHPPQDLSSSDSRDLLLGQAYPDLSAQLDIWTSLNFESDEPQVPENDERQNSLQLVAEEDEDESRSPVTEEKAIQDGHSNVVTPTDANPNPTAPVSNQSSALVNPAAAVAAAAAAAAHSFDLNALLSTFNLDSFAAAAAVTAATAQQPHLQQQQTQQPPAIAPSLAQLLALHSVQSVAYPPPGLLPYALPPINQPSAAPMANTFPRNTPTSSEESIGSAKRARTRKSSMTLDSPEDGSVANTSVPTSPSSLTLLSAAEDKRRRNTAASARFRLKKKEREAALESKSRELETKVVELERECETLRRENGWLKGLVVGVTGAAAPPPNGQGLAVAPPVPAAGVSVGTKRSREDAGSDSV